MADPFARFLDLDDDLAWLRWDKFWQTWASFIVIGAAMAVNVGIGIYGWIQQGGLQW